jgi:branched-chain amino acid transport system ATP-binding protein
VDVVAARAMTAGLQTHALVKRFGGLAATSDVSIRVERGARHALIGPNGAGKTTLINLLTGVLAPSSGSIELDGADITRLSVHARVRRGIVRTFQINQLFGGLTPLTTLALAVSARRGTSRRWWRSVGSDAAVGTECDRLLERFGLAEVMDQPVHALAYGKLRLLEIATAIACNRASFYRRPAAGVPHGERQEIFETISACPTTCRFCSSNTTWTSSSISRASSRCSSTARSSPRATSRRSRPTRASRRSTSARTSLSPERRVAELLQVEALRAGYGAAVVVQDVNLALAPGESVALLGRNGAGKTTLLDTLVGVTQRHAGRILLAGRDITTLPPHARAAAGIGWVPQERNIFRSLSVDENLTAIARPGPWTVQRAYAMFPRLAERKGNLGSQLSGGEQQMLAVARALLNPKLLLLDEPLEGLAPIIVKSCWRRSPASSAMKASRRSSSNRTREVQPMTARGDLDRGAFVHAAPSAGTASPIPHRSSAGWRFRGHEGLLHPSCAQDRPRVLKRRRRDSPELATATQVSSDAPDPGPDGAGTRLTASTRRDILLTGQSVSAYARSPPQGRHAPSTQAGAPAGVA